MKKICFFIDNISHVGGTERVCLLIANAFGKNSDYQIFIMNKSKPKEIFYSISKQIQVRYLEEIHHNRYFSMIWKLRQFLKKEKIDVIIDVDTSFAPITEVSRFLLPTKHIAWEHFNATLGKCSLKQKIGRKIALHFADHFILLTESDRKNYPKQKKNVQVIPNPLPFFPKEQAILENPQFVSIGRLTEQKGFDQLIEAFALLSPRYPEWTLKIAGDGELREQLQKQIEQKKLEQKIKLIGVQQDILPLLLESSIFVVSSRYEGFPMVILEAMSCGLPVVSFDCPYGPGNMISNSCGILVKPGQVKQLATGMEHLAAEKKLRKKMGQKAREEVKQYRIEIIIEKWLALLK